MGLRDLFCPVDSIWSIPKLNQGSWNSGLNPYINPKPVGPLQVPVRESQPNNWMPRLVPGLVPEVVLVGAVMGAISSRIQ